MVSFKRQKAETVFSACFYSKEALCSTNRETSPTELPSPEATPHVSASEVATALNPVWEHHIHFMHLLAECVLRVPAALVYAVLAYEELQGVLCFQAVGKPGLGTGGAADLPFASSPHCPQSSHHVIFRHFVKIILPFTSMFISPVHNHDFT